MDDVALGRRVRAVRVRLGLRQSDVACRAGVSQDTVSRVERGRLSALQLKTVRSVLTALDVELRLEAWWRSGEIDRVADEDHASLVEVASKLLERLGWETRAELSFSVYGERGSIDLVAWHAKARVLLVIEVKTTLMSVEETLRRHEVKVRLGRRIVEERLGWQPLAVARLLVLPDTTTNRRRIARHAAVFAGAYPIRGRAAAAWLRAPVGPGCLLAFLSSTPGERGRCARPRPKRVRSGGTSAISHQSRSGSVNDRKPGPA